MAINDWEYKTVNFAGRMIKVAQEKENASVRDEHIAEATLKYEARFRLENIFVPELSKHFRKLLLLYKHSVAVGTVPVVPDSMVTELESLLESQYSHIGEFLQELDYSKHISVGFTEDESNKAKSLYALALVGLISEILPVQAATIVNTTNKQFTEFYQRAIKIEAETVAETVGAARRIDSIAETASGLVQRSFKQRIKQIAITETGQFMNRGTLAAPDDEDLVNAGIIDDIDVEVSGTRVKQWITKLDKKVRQTHRAMHGVTIPSKDDFVVNGVYRMLCPEDPMRGAPPAEIVKCRCELVKFRSVVFKDVSKE